MSDSEKVAREVWDSVKHLRQIAAGELPQGRECRVLIVDDNRSDVELLCRQLEKFKVFCMFCNSAKEADALIAANQFDVVMVDLAMPVIDGADFIKSAMGRTIGTSFVLITGHSADAPIMSKVLKLGGVVSFEKPITDEQLRGVFPLR